MQHNQQPYPQPQQQPAAAGGPSAAQAPGLPYPGQGSPSMAAGPGVLSSDDVEEAQTPSAPPPVQDMDKIRGYQKFVKPDVAFVPPPPYAAASQPTAAPEQFHQGARITEQEARECLVRYAKSQCCWGTSAAQSMTIDSILPTTAVHYILRTFQETRATDWACEPFRGQYIDGPANGMPPQPWDVQISSPPPFMEQVMNVEVPHTASVKICHNCQGHARIICYACGRWGYRRCMSCSGGGLSDRGPCYRCHGSGRIQCLRCRGMGRVPCGTCDATGRVKCFIRLTAAFQIQVTDFILERTPLPDHLIRNVTGNIMLEDTQPRLLPIRSFPEPAVNQQSQLQIQQHSQLAQSGRILMQYHGLRGVPVFQCDCTHKNKPVQFFVYGNDRKVHAPDYPQKCCGGCQLL